MALVDPGRMDKDDVDEIHRYLPNGGTKTLRACLQCRVVMNKDQFFELGCPNCKDLTMQGSEGRVAACTSSNFSGFISLVKPGAFVSRYIGLSHRRPGCYALMVKGRIPDRILRDPDSDHEVLGRTTPIPRQTEAGESDETDDEQAPLAGGKSRPSRQRGAKNKKATEPTAELLGDKGPSTPGWPAEAPPTPAGMGGGTSWAPIPNTPMGQQPVPNTPMGQWQVPNTPMGLGHLAPNTPMGHLAPNTPMGHLAPNTPLGLGQQPVPNTPLGLGQQPVPNTPLGLGQQPVPITPVGPGQQPVPITPVVPGQQPVPNTPTGLGKDEVEAAGSRAPTKDEADKATRAAGSEAEGTEPATKRPRKRLRPEVGEAAAGAVPQHAGPSPSSPGGALLPPEGDDEFAG